MTQVKSRVLLGLAVTLVLILALLILGTARTAQAAPGFSLVCSPTSAAPGKVVTIVCTAPGAYTYHEGTVAYCGMIFEAKWEFGMTNFSASWIYNELLDTVIDWQISYTSEKPRDFLNWSLTGCGAGGGEPFAAALWAAHVCEPDDGFSPDGWSTLDANTIPPDTKLWVAAGPEGPWYATEFMQPPYVMSTAHVDGLTSWMGLTDYHLLWFKGGETGIAANYGSMIEDREAIMNDLCGS